MKLESSVPWHWTLCYNTDLLKSTFSFASKTRCWFLSHYLTQSVSTEYMQCNHRPQGDEFIENILQYPARSAECCLHFNKSTGRRDLHLYHIPALSLLQWILQGPLIKVHWAGLSWLDRHELEEMRDDIKSSPFPKLKSRWLPIIFHVNLHLELHLLVEWSMAITERELCLQK